LIFRQGTIFSGGDFLAETHAPGFEIRLGNRQLVKRAGLQNTL